MQKGRKERIGKSHAINMNIYGNKNWNFDFLRHKILQHSKTKVEKIFYIDLKTKL